MGTYGSVPKQHLALQYPKKKAARSDGFCTLNCQANKAENLHLSNPVSVSSAVPVFIGMNNPSASQSERENKTRKLPNTGSPRTRICCCYKLESLYNNPDAGRLTSTLT